RFNITVARSAKHHSDAGDQLPRAEWFGEVIIGPHRQPDQLVSLFDPRGQHDDVTVRKGAHQPAHLNPINPGKAQVTHDQSRLPPASSLHSYPAIASHLNHNAIPLKTVTHQ